VIQSLHSTAALFVNEWQSALLDDFRTLLEQAVSADAPWQHNDPRYSTAIAAMPHPICVRSCWNSAVLAVRSGRVMRGVWQSIILAEMMGPGRAPSRCRFLGADGGLI